MECATILSHSEAVFFEDVLITLLTILAVGFLLGMRHATDADHVIAVSTIVTREQKAGRAAMIGAVWGVGHTVTIFAVGSVLILFRITLPARVGLSMELAVGLMLIVLGLRNLRASFSWPVPRRRHEHAPTVHYHAHGDYIHAHSSQPAHPPSHTHQETPVSRLDDWFGQSSLYLMLRPLLIGIVHGLAGSAAIALLVLSTIPSARWAVGYLLIFGFGTVLGMMLITLAMASTFAFGQKHFVNLGRHFEWAAGAISLVFGMFVTYQIGFGAGLFTANPVWIPK
jgi:ABC-type nickel/cobalt efflux system permease component RcnA